MTNEEKVGQNWNCREGWIDIAKAIGILLVLLAHALPKEYYVWGYINQFHMPLFYFLSGYLYRCKGNFTKFLKNKIRGLYVPYVASSLIMCVAMFLIRGDRTSVKTFVKIFLLQERGPWLGAIWFLGVLFYAMVIYDLAHRLIRKTPLSEKATKIMFYMATAVILVVGIHVKLPYRISNIMVAIGFLALGEWIKTQNLLGKLPLWGGLALLALVGVLNLFTHVSVSTNTYTIPLLFLVSATAGALGVARLSILINGSFANLVLDHIRWIGKNTIGIVIWQFIAFKAIISLQILVYGLPWDRIWDFPVIYEYTNILWVVLLVLAGTYFSIAIYKVYEITYSTVCELGKKLCERNKRK